MEQTHIETEPHLFHDARVVRHAPISDWQLDASYTITPNAGRVGLSKEMWAFIEPSPEAPYTSQAEQDMDNLKLQMASIQRDLSKCVELIGNLTDFITTAAIKQSTAINSITIDGADVLLDRPLFIVLEEYEDETEVTARIPEFQAAGFGPTEIQAINDLKVFLGELYQDLLDTPDEKLGKLPLQWKGILQKIVGANA